MSKIKFYKDQVALNVLSGSVQNSKEIYEACEGHVVVGLLSKDYESTEAAITDMKEHALVCDNAVSVGLGAGDPKQCYEVVNIIKDYTPKHVNQVFTAVGNSRASTEDDVFINCLVSPTGKPGYVNIATGPRSSQAEPAIVHIETAIEMIKDMGGNSIKFFPMRGLETKDEYIEVCKACAKQDFYLEPTGGITKENFTEILQIALDHKVKKIIPHVYSSIIDKETNETIISDLDYIYGIIKEIVK